MIRKIPNDYYYFNDGLLPQLFRLSNSNTHQFKVTQIGEINRGPHRSIPDSQIQGQTFALKAAEHSTSMFSQPAAFTDFFLIFFN